MAHTVLVSADELPDAVRIKPKPDQFTLAPSVREERPLAHHLFDRGGVPYLVGYFAGTGVRARRLQRLVRAGRDCNGFRAARYTGVNHVLG